MHASISFFALYAAAAAALSSRNPSRDLIGRQFGDCKLPDCPDGWSVSACNGGTPDFCCPGSSSVNITNGQGTATCCIGGSFRSTDPEERCEGGVLVTVGSDLAAYTSSVYAALSSVSGGSDGATTSAESDGASTSASSGAAQTITTTDASGNAVTTTSSVSTTSSGGGAAGMATGVPRAVMGVFAVVVVAVDLAI